MPTDYNQIAEDYKESKEAPWRLHIEWFNFAQVLGPVAGRSVLDLACGEGHYTRRLRQLGAARVVGVDLSTRMIELARQQEALRPLGLEYVAEDARTVQLQPFDLVVAAYLLNYARTAQELLAMAQAIARHLKPGGRFVTVNNNPSQPPATFADTRKYGFVKSSPGPLAEGTPITYTCFLDEGRTVTFDNYYLARTTHEQVVHQAGLKNMRWHPLQVSPQGIQEFGADYWQLMLQAQPIICLDCSL